MPVAKHIIEPGVVKKEDADYRQDSNPIDIVEPAGSLRHILHVYLQSELFKVDFNLIYYFKRYHLLKQDGND